MCEGFWVLDIDFFFFFFFFSFSFLEVMARSAALYRQGGVPEWPFETTTFDHYDLLFVSSVGGKLDFLR